MWMCLSARLPRVRFCDRGLFVFVSITKYCSCLYTHVSSLRQGFLFSELATAKTYFEKAKVYFQKALDLEPSNEIYQKSLEVTAKAPLIHKEMQEQLKVECPIRRARNG